MLLPLFCLQALHEAQAASEAAKQADAKLDAVQQQAQAAEEAAKGALARVEAAEQLARSAHEAAGAGAAKAEGGEEEEAGASSDRVNELQGKLEEQVRLTHVHCPLMSTQCGRLAPWKERKRTALRDTPRGVGSGNPPRGLAPCVWQVAGHQPRTFDGIFRWNIISACPAREQPAVTNTTTAQAAAVEIPFNHERAPLCLTRCQAHQLEQLHTDVHSQLGQVATDMAGIMADVQHTTATLQVRCIWWPRAKVGGSFHNRLLNTRSETLNSSRQQLRAVGAGA